MSALNSFDMRDPGRTTGCGIHPDCGFDRSGRKDGGSYQLWDDVNHGDLAARRKQQERWEEIRDSADPFPIVAEGSKQDRLDRLAAHYKSLVRS